MIITISDLKKAIIEAKILERYKLQKIGIFGSFARGEKFNDIDIYIDEDDFDFEKAEILQEELEKLTQIKIDLMRKTMANPIVLYRAQKDMVYVTA